MNQYCIIFEGKGATETGPLRKITAWVRATHPMLAIFGLYESFAVMEVHSITREGAENVEDYGYDETYAQEYTEAEFSEAIGEERHPGRGV